MSPNWDDVSARARGLATHLLPSSTFDRLRATTDLGQLVRELDRLGRPLPIEREAHPVDLELGVRRWAASQLRILARWLGNRSGTMAVLFLDEDRRSVRALLRGAAAGVGSQLRLAGLIPTPELSEGALEELARQGTPGQIAALLSLWQHPFGPALQAVSSDESNWLELEIELSRAFAREALRHAKDGGSALVRYVEQVIDIENCWSALAMAGEAGAAEAPDPFVPGGAVLARERFAAAAAAPDPQAAASILAGALGRRGLGAVFERHAAEPYRLEEEALDWVIEALRHDARLAPLGPASVLRYALELRRECQRLRRVVWEVYLNLTPDRAEPGETR